MIATFLALWSSSASSGCGCTRGMFGPIRVFRPVGPPAEGAPAPG